MQIFVKTLDGRTLNLALTDGTATTVLAVKHLIHEREGIAVGAQRLIYGGKTLEDGDTLMNNNIQRESTLHLVLRLDGGHC